MKLPVSRFAIMLLTAITVSCRKPVSHPTNPATGNGGATAVSESESVQLSSSSAVSGRVVDSRDHPIAGARVRIQGRAASTVTDTQGRFQLQLPRALARDSADKRSFRITASKPGYIIGGIPLQAAPRRIQLAQLPDRDNPDYAWVDPTPDKSDPQRCGNCHETLYEQWQQGGHASTTTNGHFLDLYTGQTVDGHGQPEWGLLTEYPEGAGVCAACHFPSASLDKLGTADVREIDGVAQLGVHCDYCHKVQDVDTEALGLTHGRFAADLLRPHPDATETGQLFFGPLDDVDRGEDSHLPLLSKSEFCAACHEGIVFGVPVYTTYTEWQKSRAAQAGRQCQSCHMRHDTALTNIAEGHGGLHRNPQTLASHDLLPGGRLAMLRSCLDIQATIHSATTHNELVVRIITHDVGHRVPTGFVDRHLILAVDGYDRAGHELDPLEGETLPAAVGPRWQGKAGRLFAKLLSDPDGHWPVPFWRAGATADDRRLKPDSTVTLRYRFSQNLDSARVRLLYRRFWHATLVEKGWDDSSELVYDSTVSTRRSQSAPSHDAVVD